MFFFSDRWFNHQQDWVYEYTSPMDGMDIDHLNVGSREILPTHGIKSCSTTSNPFFGNVPGWCLRSRNLHDLRLNVKHPAHDSGRILIAKDFAKNENALNI